MLAPASAPPEASDIRWKQRFDNLQRAYKRLRSMLDLAAQDPESDVIRMAVIKAYEFTFELSWKTLKDYLSYNGIDARAKAAVLQIQRRYLAGLEQLHTLLNTKLQETP